MSNAYVTEDDVKAECRNIVMELAGDPTWAAKNVKAAINNVTRDLARDHKYPLPFGTVRKLWYGTRDTVPSSLHLNLQLIRERYRAMEQAQFERTARGRAKAQDVLNRRGSEDAATTKLDSGTVAE